MLNQTEVLAQNMEVADMSLIRSKQSLDLVRNLYQNAPRKQKKVLTSFFLQPNQKAIIDGLAEQTGKGKADVVRDIIDEWCELQLRDCGQ